LALANGRRTIELDSSPASLREALEDLFTLYPGLRDRIITEQGSIREHVNLFIGREDVRYLDGLETKLGSGSEILIVPAVSGGADCLLSRVFIAVEIRVSPAGCRRSPPNLSPDPS
jgi:molybdopterin converting factor small subunit